MRPFFILLLLFPFTNHAQRIAGTGTFYDDLNARLLTNSVKTYNLKEGVRSITETDRIAFTTPGQKDDSLYISRYSFSREGLLVAYSKQNESGSMYSRDSFIYDNKSRLLKERVSENRSIISSSSYVSKYDQGFLVSRHVTYEHKSRFDPYTEEYIATYTYNKDRSEVSVTHNYIKPARYKKQEDFQCQFLFDEDGRITGYTSEDTAIMATIQYHPKWNLPEWIISRSCDSFGCTWSYEHNEYDNKGRLISSSINNHVTQPVFLFKYCYEYEYNENGNTSRNMIRAGNREEIYGEEKIYRSETAWASEYIYDAKGNWTERKEFHAPDPKNKLLNSVTKREILYY